MVNQAKDSLKLNLVIQSQIKPILLYNQGRNPLNLKIILQVRIFQLPNCKMLLHLQTEEAAKN